MLVRRALGSLGYDVVRMPHTSLSVHLARLFRDFGIDCVLDVGAHRGEFGRQLRELGFDGKIISFEPVEAEFEELRRVGERDASWEVRRLALGSEQAVRPINVSEATQFSSFLPALGEAAARFPTSREARRENVQIERLDDVWPSLELDHSTKIYLKLDTQGWDLEVLKGAGLCISQIVALQSELALTHVYAGGPDYGDALAYITSLGFAVTGIFPVISDDLGRLIEVDCVFARTERRL